MRLILAATAFAATLATSAVMAQEMTISCTEGSLTLVDLVFTSGGVPSMIADPKVVAVICNENDNDRIAINNLEGTPSFSSLADVLEFREWLTAYGLSHPTIIGGS
jgi:hypothetical protein